MHWIIRGLLFFIIYITLMTLLNYFRGNSNPFEISMVIVFSGFIISIAWAYYMHKKYYINKV